MSESDRAAIERLTANCSALEEQVKLLVSTELKLRRTQGELVQSREKIEEYNRTLEQRVEERTRELSISNEKLKLEMVEREKAQTEMKKLENSLKRAEKMEAVGILASSVAHDLNNILSGIIGYPQLILRKMTEDNPQRKFILAIKQCGENAAAVVQDLLTLARRGIINPELMNLNDVVLRIADSPEIKKLLEEHPAIRVNKTIEPLLNSMEGSPVHIHSAIMNVMINAVEAMEQGGVLTVSTKNVCLDKPAGAYELVDAGEYVSVVISDTGSGISKKDLNRIFEPFYTRKIMGKKSGTGLGLAVAWGTVKDHQGFIDLESEEGKGTTFRLYFPAKKEKIIKPVSPLQSDNCKGNNESILIVDDVELQRDVGTEMLTELGYRVSAVCCGEDAVTYLEKNSVDLLVLDMIMDPGINGLETYKRVIKIHPGQKAIIASGFSQTELVKEAQSLGAGAYVRKPYTLETIALAIKKELSGRSA